jgi:ABC-type cobalamin/Fe3+-siderophores transport system ATPase subunit
MTRARAIAASQPMTLASVELEDITLIKGVPFPAGERFRQTIVTPPGSGKTTLVAKLGGWPEEGYLDLAASNWWRSPILTFRPREVHFGCPFVGYEESHTVFEREWLEAAGPPRPEPSLDPACQALLLQRRLAQTLCV